MKSMTGYAKVNFENDDFKVKVEVKSVNNKYLNLNLKYHYLLNFLDSKMRTLVSNYVTRGSVDMRIEINDKREKNNLLQYDANYAKNYLSILDKIEMDFREKIPNKLDYLIKNPNVICKRDDEEDDAIYVEVVMDNIEKALKELNKMRRDEGERLKDYFIERIEVFTGIVNEIKLHREKVMDDYKQRLLTRINGAMAEIKVDEQDILKELMLFADRSDISEEISRLDSHIVQIKKEFGNENNGKKMDFLLQEMFREINTTGVKANYYEISKLIVEAKNELEKIREQVQNIE